MEFEIHPYQSVDNFVFGASESEVAAKNGPPLERVDDPIMGEVQETRPGLLLIYVDDTLVEVTIDKDQKALLDGIDIFGDTGAAETLKAKSKFTEGDNGVLVLDDLGLCLRGFGKKKVPEGRTVTAFARDRLEFYGFMTQV